LGKAIEWAVESEVDVISMSWAIDEKPQASQGQEDPGGRALRTAIGKAIDANILLFCAHPDKGPGENNTTYPKNLDIASIICIGAATSDGNPWGKIGDSSANFYLPGVELGIPAETKDVQRKNLPPERWHKSSGSSLSCALASGLAAMILHCARLVAVGYKEWQYLKSAKGMKEALGRINASKNGWLPVRTVFGGSFLMRAVSAKDQKEALRVLVERFLANMDPQAKLNV